MDCAGLTDEGLSFLRKGLDVGGHGCVGSFEGFLSQHACALCVLQRLIPHPQRQVGCCSVAAQAWLGQVTSKDAGHTMCDARSLCVF